MRLPSFRFIENFYVQSKHGLKFEGMNLNIGDEVEVSNMQPCTVRRLYNSCLIGNADQVRRHCQKIGIHILSRFERSEGLEGKDVSVNENSTTGLKSTEFKKAKK
jgi:hypothetical protein